jgi:kynurenine 3-monooxygenase
MAPREQDNDNNKNNGNNAISSSSSSSLKKVLIIGAGPAGLLSTILFLRRNEKCRANGKPPKYHVTIVDPGTDYGTLDEDGLKRHRSWMIGLTAHGTQALASVEDLTEEYLESAGLRMKGFTIGMGPSIRFDVPMTAEEISNVGFIVDRNYICAGLARYLNEKYMGQKPRHPTKTKATWTDHYKDVEFTTYYNTRALFVDAEEQTVLVRTMEPNHPKLPTGVITALDYDLIVGCDGIRSIVRNAFVTNHRDFECSLEDNFAHGKAVHITRPKTVQEGWFFMLSNCLPNMVSFILPERGDQINLGMGHPMNAPCAPEMTSNDPSVVAAYMKQHFKAFELDYDEFGKKWVEQSWTTTGQVYCNFYHSMKLKALLLGDAAHATVPNIGQGMNTALADAKVLDDLLDKYNDDFDKVLPEYSNERVKEGNALTDLSFNTFSLDSWMQMEILVRQNLRRVLNYYFPWFVNEDPMSAIALGKKLSEAYNEVNKLGYLKRSRRLNQDLKRRWFEKQVGMVIEPEKRSSLVSTATSIMWVVAGGIAVMAIGFLSSKESRFFNFR